MLKKILKALLYLFIIALISAAVIAGFIFMDRPLQEALIVLAVLFGLWLLIVLIRKLIIRYRARAQVKRILQEEQALVVDEDSQLTPNQLQKDLKKGWRQALSALKRSQLKLHGDPLYVLPWYMVIGKPRSGKSTALRNAKLLLPEIDLPEHEDGSTLNLEWWLYEQAIVIDTAGRYSVPEQSKRDRKEWGVLLNMLSRHKQKEPLNGLILVVAADRLLGCTDEELVEEGRQVRASVTELMEKLEIQLPIYLMITKCDLIEGFNDWCRYVPEDSFLQPMGYLHEDEGADNKLESLLDNSFDSVMNRIKELRLLLLERSTTPSKAILCLPNEMEKLRKGLHLFAKTALKENPYQDTPRFRGLYFSSSRQSINQNKPDFYTDRGLFLHQLFTRVLPGDRGLLKSLPSATRIRRAARTYATSIGGGITLLLLVAMSLAFMRDLDTLTDISSVYGEINVQTADINDRMQALYRMRDMINKLSEAEDQWVIPWLGSYGSSEQRRALIETYNKLFSEQILAKLDQPLKNRINLLQKGETSNLAAGLIRRINLLRSQIEEDSPELMEKPPVTLDYLLMLNNALSRESATLFNELYISYLHWHPSPPSLVEERSFLQTALLKVIEKNHGDYAWVIEWANSQGGDPVALEDFWGGSRKVEDAYSVLPSYTLEGREFIQEFLAELDEASQGAGRLSAIKKDFEKYYQREYVKSWIDFASNFDQGKDRLRDRKEWLVALEQMGTASNPYFSLMERMHRELKPFNTAERFPSKTLIDYFHDMQNFSGGPEGGDSKLLQKAAKKGLKVIGKAGTAGKAVAKVGKTGMKASKKAKKLRGKSKEQLDNVLEESAKTLDEYKKAMSETVFNAESLSQSYGTLTSYFKSPDMPGAGDGPAAAAWKAILKLQSLIGRPTPNSSIFWRLYTGPVQLIYDYMEEETACYLQRAWEDNVLAELEGVDKNKLGNIMIGEQGLVWNYVEKEAGPFLKKRFQKGYLPAKVDGRVMVWSDNFMRFVNAASAGRFIVGSEFSVKLSALPSGVNQGAMVSPYATFLDLHCADGIQTLANYNYSDSKEFLWSLEKCGDVSLRVEIGQLRLVKHYKGVKGFSNFLLDFRDGRRVFTPVDFPEQASQLTNEGVSAIDVSYEITGQEPVIKMLDAVPLNPPTGVVQCWQ